MSSFAYKMQQEEKRRDFLLIRRTTKRLVLTVELIRPPPVDFDLIITIKVKIRFSSRLGNERVRKTPRDHSIRYIEL